jgi:hypothetical protein
VGVDERLILKHLKEMGWEVIGYIALAQDSDRWRADLNAVMKIGFHKMRRIS